MHLLLSLFFSILIIPTHCDDRKTYIVYLGDLPKGMEITELHHTSMVQGVLGRHKPLTTRSWDFIGMPQQVKRSSLESDIVIGVVDYGIWPESDSFKGQGFGPPPAKWKGSCQNFTCNNKIVGAKYFIGDATPGKDDIISPMDTHGHGTHCASTVSGNWVNSVSLFGLGLGTARGGVPSARIAVYKPCWASGCFEADILKALDEAIADGVDVISMSLGPTQVIFPHYFQDIHAIGAFHAMKKNILTSIAANNLGPQLFTMTMFAPWSLAVAASTMDRKFFTKVQLGNGRVIEGVSVNTFDLHDIKYPLIYSGDAPNIAGGFNSSISSLCGENSLNKALVKGKILVCDSAPTHNAAQKAGAVGLIVPFISSKDVAYAFPLPCTKQPTATIFKSNEGKDPLSPYVASFSSRGPNPITPDILKPDIAAPGVDILAAWPPKSSVSEEKGDKRESTFNIISGTSMACPHASAAAAYVKSFHPKWSPAAIKSALMTTAAPMSPELNPEAEFSYGAGQINPVKAVTPGLVYDINEADYVGFLCGQGYTTKILRHITNDDFDCKKTKKENARDLNLPSLALKTTKSKPFSTMFHRTVTNVGAAKSVYKSKVIVPSSLLTIQVTPDVLSFSSVGEKKSFTVSIEGSINVPIVSASLIWDDGKVQVRSPIVVYDLSVE
ncbi:hypothetical protein K1719_039740 [Acacia pycnantha]|nr:hypothetical protein K1719_039740 [Acacia pycnantha]